MSAVIEPVLLPHRHTVNPWPGEEWEPWNVALPRDHRNPRCPRDWCGVIWRQAGNETGHCSACHRTFGGRVAFARHQVTRGGRSFCVDVAEDARFEGNLVTVLNPDKTGTYGRLMVWTLALTDAQRERFARLLAEQDGEG